MIPIPRQARDEFKKEFRDLSVLFFDSREDLDAQRDKNDEWMANWDKLNKPRILVALVQHENLICCVDVAYGGHYVWNGTVWNYGGAHQVITDEYIFVSDYYGYSDGRLYRSVETNP